MNANVKYSQDVFVEIVYFLCLPKGKARLQLLFHELAMKNTHQTIVSLVLVHVNWPRNMQL